MDVWARVIAILVEVLILASVISVLIFGVRLTIFDLGLDAKYKKVASMALILAGGMVLVFFIAHLTAFYPGLPGE